MKALVIELNAIEDAVKRIEGQTGYCEAITDAQMHIANARNAIAAKSMRCVVKSGVAPYKSRMP